MNLTAAGYARAVVSSARKSVINLAISDLMNSPTSRVIHLPLSSTIFEHMSKCLYLNELYPSPKGRGRSVGLELGHAPAVVASPRTSAVSFIISDLMSSPTSLVAHFRLRSTRSHMSICLMLSGWIYLIPEDEVARLSKDEPCR